MRRNLRIHSLSDRELSQQRTICLKPFSELVDVSRDGRAEKIDKRGGRRQVRRDVSIAKTVLLR